LIFTFLGTTVNDKVLGPFVNGLSLAVVIYFAANISGGHINPAVTFSVFISGYYPMLHSCLYVIVQCVGAICGSLLVNALTPFDKIFVGMGDGGPGCFDSTSMSHEISKRQLFGWEVIMTFTLISTVYACGIAKPGHGSMTPLAVGFSLLACAGAGGKYSGAALNPARVIGPLAVYRCGTDVAWIYILAQLLAAVFACSIFAVVGGWGPLFPSKSRKLFNLSATESMQMFLTGQPPKRFRKHGDANVHMMSLMGKSFLSKSFLGRGMSAVKRSGKSLSSGRRNSDDVRRSTSIDEDRNGDHNGDVVVKGTAENMV
jgi:glycerol uptake facilitator-like aquaporin